MAQLKAVVNAASASGIRSRITIIIAGAPVTEKYCRTIGADFYARDMVGAAEMAKAACG
jgi:methanogenic corrinoid protein MtbC1